MKVKGTAYRVRDDREALKDTETRAHLHGGN